MVKYILQVLRRRVRHLLLANHHQAQVQAHNHRQANQAQVLRNLVLHLAVVQAQVHNQALRQVQALNQALLHLQAVAQLQVLPCRALLPVAVQVLQSQTRLQSS